MSITIHGFSAHFYDAKANSDKFYRAFIWTDGAQWFLAKHWGRDGTTGTVLVDPHASENRARVALARKLADELKKGYQLLGEGRAEVRVQRILDADDMLAASERLHDWIGRPPIKLPEGFQFIIREEPDLEDLLT